MLTFADDVMHLFQRPDHLVRRSLRAAVALNPNLCLHLRANAVFLSHPSPNAVVAVVSGGGAGHEPAHAGYTGRGMLAASVSGDIFASPSASQILTAIQLTRADSVLLVVNNYTGDRLNFGLAAEKARAANPALDIQTVVVADDISITAHVVGPRGLAGNILVCKILGALAERGASLPRLKLLGDTLVRNLASIGAALGHCHVPGRPKPSRPLIPEGEYELGLGLHNEPGVHRKQLLSQGPTRLIADMLRGLLPRVHPPDQVVLFVNNLGGFSQLEMGAALDEVLLQLRQAGIIPIRIYLSAYMTSLNAPAFSISLLNVSAVRAALDKDFPPLIDLLDDPTEALAWIGIRSAWPSDPQTLDSRLVTDSQEDETPIIPGSWTQMDRSAFRSGIQSACERVLSVRDDLNAYDAILGDADCGETFAAGANATLISLARDELDPSKLGLECVIQRLAGILEQSMGGTVGALFAIFFNSFSAILRDSPPGTDDMALPTAIQRALESLTSHTPAKPGNRTLIDALHPFCATLVDGKGLREASDAARRGADATRKMTPVLGRAAYVVGAGTGKMTDLPPDPGAWGVAAIIEGFCDGFLHPSVP